MFSFRYFARARETYAELLKGTREAPSRGMNVNIYKPKRTARDNVARDLVTANFTMELEFYEFCKARLNKQYSALLII